MSVKRLPNGRYKVEVDVGGRGPDRRRMTRVVADEDRARALERQLRKRGAADHHRTVLDAVDRWLHLYGGSVEPNTENTYRSTRNVYLANTWLGAVELDRLDVDDLQRFYGEVFAGTWRKGGTKRSASTVRKIHRLMSVAFADARRAHWISANPCADAVVRPPKSALPKPSAADDYDLVDVARVVDHGDTDLADLVHAALATGAREGELAGLRWRDVDLLDGAVSLHGSISAKRRAEGPGWFRKSTKTNKARKLRVDEACRLMLEARYARQIDQARVAGVDADDLDRRAVFSLELEVDYTSPAALGARWRRAADKAESPLRFHDLRHINASEMSTANVPVSSATKRGGWSSNRMYHDVYGHHRADADDQAVAALAETWKKITALRKAPRDSGGTEISR